MLTTLEYIMMWLIGLMVASISIQGAMYGYRESQSTESYKEILAYNLKSELDRCVLGGGETLYGCTTKVVDKYKADIYTKNLEVIKKEIINRGQQQ